MNVKKLFKSAAYVALALSAAGAGTLSSASAAVNVDVIRMASQVTPNGIANFGQGDASITITPNGSQTLVGKKFNVYKLFDAENAKGGESINYTFNPTYAPALKAVVGEKLNIPADQVTEYQVIDYMQTMNNHIVEGAQADQTLEGRYSDYRYFVEELRTKMVEMNLAPDVVTVTQVKSDGSFDIGGLEYGYYLVDEVTSVQDTHQAASLVMMNTANPNASVQIKSDFPSIIKKILEDDNGTGWNDVADYEIGQTVPYKYESTIPNINGYHTYYFTVHDKMDEALTFDAGSMQIQISDGTKTYTLKSSEFKTTENVDGETFKTEIQDIKAIIDREFPNFNDDNENVYGQSVTWTYNATLNDKAALETGRPGFENDVRLEFSNNPDADGAGETGFTPWDTVVAFTYKINGLKVNNHDLKLEDAHFRLYSDEDCTNEVLVKANPNGDGYVVINRDSLGGNDHTGGTAPAEAIEMISDADGVFKIYGLDQGTYWLKETDSPAGYRELLDPIEITITPTFTTERQDYVKGDGATDKTLVALDATAHVHEFLSGAYKDTDQTLSTNVADGSVNITVVNTVGTKLPITGGSGIYIILGAGVVLTALGALGAKKIKKENEEA